MIDLVGKNDTSRNNACDLTIYFLYGQFFGTRIKR